MSNELNQDDVFNLGGASDPVDNGASMFDTPAAAMPPKSSGGRAIAGLPLGTWLVIGFGLCFVGFIGWRLLAGGDRADPGMLEAVADSAMTLEPEAQSASIEQAEQSIESAAVAAPPQLPAMDPAAHAADLAAPAVAPATATPAVPQETPAPAVAVVPPAETSAVPTLPTQSEPAVAAQVSVPATAAAVQQSVPAVATQQEVDSLKGQLTALQAEVARLKANQRAAPRAQNARSETASRSAPTTTGRSTAGRSKPAPAAAAKQSLPPVTGVSLRAVVGDVAWVQTTAGESVQVRPGDVIPGIGTVKTISAETSEVRLEDGRSLN
ncbi:hypothetical protein [Pseudoxanthomonas kaohsiungensis]|uniref:Type IV pilus biogenesis protein PilP n=1 Tax=Pseudoxanthomonas kaohsiungensis TaxID=283923 RepID=A0ABW3LXC6_9GAMM|nr:hypothetical protein [Pseudoxanthomonas kaohsiungensis]KAF1702956.1 hypothetical protein CSC66_09280 [Pseudoxanthomonas kaohsiungensis]